MTSTAPHHPVDARSVDGPGARLDADHAELFEASPDLHGFGGLHGGFELALLTTAMQRQTPPGMTLRSATAHLHRPVRSTVRRRTTAVHAGRSLVNHAGSLDVDDQHPAVTASAVFAAARRGGPTIDAPTPPAVLPPERCEPFAVPTELLPLAQHLEIRPTDGNRPFAGGPVPELTAWIRLLGDDRPPDAHRLVVLLDALAPSYAAVLDVPALVPTVELTVHPGPGIALARSPWVLLRARSRFGGLDGWISEHLDAWSTDGIHLGSATQLRLLKAG